MPTIEKGSSILEEGAAMAEVGEISRILILEVCMHTPKENGKRNVGKKLRGTDAGKEVEKGRARQKASRGQFSGPPPLAGAPFQRPPAPCPISDVTDAKTARRAHAHPLTKMVNVLLHRHRKD
ncbi:hypothetical protein KM043_017351 [Ampulex compressa]|nr:hypothetical protein KM043_017351 [Ampulex compressa]